MIFYGGMDAVAGPMLKQMKTLGLHARFVAGDGVCSEKLPVETYAPYAYDAVMVFAAAMQKAQPSDPARFLPVLAGIRHLGVTGTIAFDPHGDLRDAAMTLYTYRQGKKVKLLVVRAK